MMAHYPIRYRQLRVRADRIMRLRLIVMSSPRFSIGAK